MEEPVKRFVISLANKHEYNESKIIPIINDSLNLVSLPTFHNTFATFLSYKFPFISASLDKIVPTINYLSLFTGFEFDHKCSKTLDIMKILQRLSEMCNIADSIVSALDTTPVKKESLFYKSIERALDTTPVNQDELFETEKLINKIIKNISEVDMKKEVELLNKEMENITNDLKELKDKINSESFISEFNENDMELIVGNAAIFKEKLHNFYEELISASFIPEFNPEISHKNAEKFFKMGLNKEYKSSNSMIL